MAKKTIAQLRENAVYQLAKRKIAEPTEQDIANARRTMNSFYRLCGLDEQLLYLENDERMYDRPSTKEKSEKRDRWYERLNKIFQTEYDAQLEYFGYCPTICAKGTTQDLYLRYFYN